MQQCPKCSSSHEKNGKFCSRKCANSRVFSCEAIEKKRVKANIRISKLSEEEIKNQVSLMVEARLKQASEYRKDFDVVGYDLKRRIIIHEQENKCNNCALDKWLEQPLVLEIDHINGQNKDHRRENMVALCPNCHSLTPTWRGRNKKLKRLVNAVGIEPTP